MRFQKCEFCEKWDFRNVNLVKIEISEMWILWKLRFQKGEFLDKMWIFAPAFIAFSQGFEITEMYIKGTFSRNL